MRLCVQLQLRPNQEQAQALKETLTTANKAADYVSEIAWDAQVFGQFKLHKLVYSDIRSQFGLPAQLAVRVIAKVADAYKIKRHKKRLFKPLGAVAFDARNFSLFADKSMASLSTLQGRQKIPFSCGKRQRELLEFQFGEADLVYLKRKWFLFVTINVEEPPIGAATGALGIDFGIVNIATDSEGQVYSGETLTKVRKRYAGLRQRLQSCGTPSAKRHLQNRSRKEKNFAKTLNHTIAKQIVEKAQRHSQAVALEDLKGIRETTVRRAQRLLHHSWAFGQLRNFIAYKAQLVGTPVVLVEPAYTSQTCPECGHIARGNRPTQDNFRCQACGYAGHADTIAARNIAARAAVNQPIVGIATHRNHLQACPVYGAGS